MAQIPEGSHLNPAPLAIIAAAVGLGAVATNYADIVSPAHAPAGLEAHEEVAGASVLGQFRTSAAASLYLRTDLYLHGGVELRPMTEQEKRAGRQGSGVKPGETAILGDESHLVTSIPPKESDFRGLLGDLERETGAFKDMHHHKHNDAETAFPLFRLMTWVDPEFITGWTTGSMLLTGEKTEETVARALEFLQAGLKANPDSPEIMTRIGVLIAAKEERIPEGLEWFERARVAALKRPNTTPDQQEALSESYRWLLIAADRLGKTERVRAIVEEALQKFPDDPVVLRFAIKLGMKVKLPK
ncbi:MAG: tetratricopeptide repeat protein [Fimbriimonas sp.]